MFGRLFDITVVSPIGESTLLVDHTKGVDNFIVKGTISRFPYTEVDTLEINIYNLAPRLLGQELILYQKARWKQLAHLV